MLFLSLLSLSTSLMVPQSKVIRNGLKHNQQVMKSRFIATQLVSLPQQCISTYEQLQETTYPPFSVYHFYHGSLLLRHVPSSYYQKTDYIYSNPTNIAHFTKKKYKNQFQPKTDTKSHHRRGARFNRGGGHQRLIWYSNSYIKDHSYIHTGIILNNIRNTFHTVIAEYEYHYVHAATPFTRMFLKMLKSILPSICYIISSQDNVTSTTSIVQSKTRVNCPKCNTQQTLRKDNITIHKHGLCGIVTISHSSNVHTLNRSNSNTQNSQNSEEVLQEISKLKSKFRKGSKATLKRQWAINNAGPKLVELEQIIQLSVNPKEDIIVQNLLQQILLDTPPFSNADNTIDNTTFLDTETDEDFIEDVMPLSQAPIIPAINNNLYLIKKALEEGNINKVTRLLDSGGIKNLDTKTLNIIKSKFPEVYTTVILNQLHFSDNTPLVNFMDESTQIQTIRYLNKQPRNAARSSLGWSTDHIQDILYYYPTATAGFFNFLQLITDGKISATTKKLLYRGRGIALIQKDKIRPIIIQCPFHKTASHILVKALAQKSIEVCGKKQLGSPISGGIEILIHTIRIILEMNSDFVIIKTDIKNAFNELSREAIINAVNEQANEILPYVHNLLNEPSEVIFNDHKSKVCAQIFQHIGVPQGSPSSGPLFNITQANALQRIESAHPDITIISVHDDHYILGKLEHALPALDMFDLEFAQLNLERQSQKSKIFHPHHDFNDEETINIEKYNLQVIKSSNGIEVAGAPIGSSSFVEDHLLAVVENIKQQLAKYIDITQTQFSTKKHDSQTLHTIMRKCISSQFTYLLRCCKPSDSERAAEILDDALFTFFIHCIDAQKEIEESNDSEVQRIRQQIFLPIRYGGCGLTSSKFITKAAFIGSISLTANWIGKIIPEICITEENINNTVYPATIEEFNNLLNVYKELMPKELENVSLLSIWENKIPKIQNIITQQLYAHEKVKFENNININDIATMGNSESQTLNYHQLKARIFKIQHISNKDSHVSAWMNSNPADRNYKMNNPAWNVAMKSRLQLNINNNTNLWCLCGEKMDHLCAHPYTCKNKNVYNAMRGPHHKKLKYVLYDLISTSNSKFKLENKREPVIEEYFPRIQQNTSDSQSTNNQRTNDEEENISGKSANRGDILLRHNTNGKVLIIDVKLTDPFAHFIKDHIHATQPANQGEDVKRKQYSKLYNMQATSTAQMIFLTLTTLGAPSKDTREFVKILFEDEPAETKKFKTQQFYERLSSAIQTIKSLNIQNTMKYHTTNQRPVIPPPYSELPSPFSARRNQLNNSVLNSELSQNLNFSQISVLQSSQISIREPNQNIRETTSDNDSSNSNSSRSRNTSISGRVTRQRNNQSSSRTSPVSRTGTNSRNSRSQSQSQQQNSSRSLDTRHQQWDNQSNNSSSSNSDHSTAGTVRYHSRSHSRNSGTVRQRSATDE